MDSIHEPPTKLNQYKYHLYYFNTGFQLGGQNLYI